MTQLKKSLKPLHLWGIAVGLVISGDYFGWNYGYSVSGLFSFFAAVIFVTVFYIGFALSFTELTVSIPNAGGPFAYAKTALGNTGGFIAGFFTLTEFLLAPPAIAAALGAYLHSLIPSLSPELISFTAFILFLGLNLLGVEQTAKFELFVTGAAASGLLLYCVLVLPYSDIGLTFRKTDQFSWLEFMHAIPFAIWFYLAVEGVAMAAEETENPKKDIPIGYSLGIGSLVLFAVSVLLITSGTGMAERLSKSDNPLPLVLSSLYPDKIYIVKIFSVLGLAGIMASLLGIILGFSRQIYALARERFLPPFLADLNEKNGTPTKAILAGGLFGLICLSVGRTDELITVSVLGAAGMYIVSLVSLFVLRKKQPELPRPFRTPFYPYLPALTLAGGVICFLSVFLQKPYLAGGYFIFFFFNLILFKIFHN
ncbi:MAG TPA: ethanolamine permease [Leptospiraceae bacterium]|nr:ethanolamine permease [Leptospiraceae bacterium]HMZ58461.1 ethanolamine permease [Leptospiraceae bacterium]HNF26779.1 ethanolamine permease [Leptospiraceae bacterium]HNI98317.1 ethanolamine permease [Leptospiraceae bacterium]HNN07145.1 ethanolamine permease [Leptospiraceae bacterium]